MGGVGQPMPWPAPPDCPEIDPTCPTLNPWADVSNVPKYGVRRVSMFGIVAMVKGRRLLVGHLDP